MNVHADPKYMLHFSLLQMVLMNTYNTTYVIGLRHNNIDMDGILLLRDIVWCNVWIECYYYNKLLSFNHIPYMLYGYNNILNICQFFMMK